jgi:hypothetical protein
MDAYIGLVGLPNPRRCISLIMYVRIELEALVSPVPRSCPTRANEEMREGS